MSEWKPVEGERVIWNNQNVITCQRRVLDPITGQRSILVGPGSWLSGKIVPFDECRPYWQPTVGDRVAIVVDWSIYWGQSGQVVKLWTMSMVLLVEVQLDNGERCESQVPWLRPLYSA